jgi:BirA family transcriptional regulator, biotin operon repressor / biotin---[acetyl-CoA-carboxylase] ligase
MFKFCYFKAISSTNDKAREFSKRGLSNLAIVADNQIKGRGRFGRKWISTQGGLYLTLLIKEKHLDKVKYLTLIACLSAAKTIIALTRLNAKAKWPNDVLINGKKICGILTETISGKENYALVGIGLNVNQKRFPENIPATSLNIETNKEYNIKKIAKTIINEFNSLYLNCYVKKDYKKIIILWREHTDTIGRKVRVKTLKGNYTGKAIGIDNDCNLVLKLDDGKTKKVMEGDIFGF